LVAICAAFFAVGYSLGRKSEPGISTASAAPSPQSASTKTKATANSTSQPPMTFYKAVEQKDANSELTPPSESKPDTNATQPNAASNQAQTPAANTSDPMTTLPSAGYFVQVAAVSKQEDAEALVEALKKKQYPAFVAATSTADKLFHVQVGPFADIKDAEAMRARLISDGYNPILKK
jgi:DedD protein